MEQEINKSDLPKIWTKFKETNDPKLRDALITNYLFLVKYVVGRLAANLPSHVSAQDMYSTGIMGLIKAVERFDPTMKNKFETYAILLVKGAIIDEMRSLDWVPRSIHQKASQVEKAQHKLQQELGRDPDDEELSEYLGVPLDELYGLMDRIKPALLISLNAPMDFEDDVGTFADRIPDSRIKTSYEVADRKEFSKMLRKAVLELPEQERTVLVLYYFENLMLKEIGEVMEVSESRISQIHSRALLRLKARLKDFITEFSNLL